MALDQILTYQDIDKAYNRIKNHVLQTPLDPSLLLTTDIQNFFYKLECYQSVKSFKIRGALNNMLTLSDDARKKGVATVSSGNHGVAVSYAAKALGIENVVVIVPETTPDSKVEKIEFYGAQIKKVGQNYDEAHEWGMDYIDQSGLTYIDSCHEAIQTYAGQGTIGIEILKQNPDIDTIIVPIGGGSMITGISVAAKAIKPSIRIVGVQTVACPAMEQAIKNNVYYESYPTQKSYCDALVGGIGIRAFEMASQCIDDVVLVSEEAIFEATWLAVHKEKIIMEPSSATTIAAVLTQRERIGGENIALVISGGNISEDMLISLFN